MSGEFKLSIALPPGWVDTTFDGDLYPSMMHEPSGVRIWVDTENCDYQRAEFGEPTRGETYHRFFFENVSCEPSGFDSIEKVEKFIQSYLMGE